MKTIHIKDSLHTQLRLKAIHSQMNIQEITESLLYEAIYSDSNETTTPKGK